VYGTAREPFRCQERECGRACQTWRIAKASLSARPPEVQAAWEKYVARTWRPQDRIASGDFFLLDQRPFAAASPEIYLKYIGFDGQGRRVRDLFHPRDLASLLDAQIRTPRTGSCRVYTAGGGADGAMSLAQLNRWCYARFGAHLPRVRRDRGAL
jgi:hypothetical protein